MQKMPQQKSAVEEERTSQINFLIFLRFGFAKTSSKKVISSTTDFRSRMK
jgi:hypothetical protein